MKTLKRRRKSNQTDYNKRIGLLKSGIPRLVFRKTNRYIIAEYVTSKEAQDKIVIGVTSKALLKHGWPKDFEGSLKSMPAAYLTGYLFGKEIVKRKLEIPIIDFGMARNQHKNKAFAFLKGLKDSGLNVNCDEQYFPEEHRINGKYLKKDFSKVFEEVKGKIK